MVTSDLTDLYNCKYVHLPADYLLYGHFEFFRHNSQELPCIIFKNTIAAVRRMYRVSSLFPGFHRLYFFPISFYYCSTYFTQIYFAETSKYVFLSMYRLIKQFVIAIGLHNDTLVLLFFSIPIFFFLPAFISPQRINSIKLKLSLS